MVYASLPGFGLSSRGQEQAYLASCQLASRPLTRVITSPLERASATADTIAEKHGQKPIVDERLTEWSLAERWAGIAWEELTNRFPGELEAYLAMPDQILFAAETLATLSARMSTAISEQAFGQSNGEIAIVSHQDPIQAARLSLSGKPLDQLHIEKPGHASIITLSPDAAIPWREIEYWEPPQGSQFPPTATTSS